MDDVRYEFEDDGNGRVPRESIPDDDRIRDGAGSVASTQGSDILILEATTQSGERLSRRLVRRSRVTDWTVQCIPGGRRASLSTSIDGRPIALTGPVKAIDELSTWLMG